MKLVKTILVFFVAAAIFIILTYPASADTSWKWTEKRPQPAWWQWDVNTEKPVRGGYIHYAATRYVGLMNPNHWPVNDWTAMAQMYEALNYMEGDFRPTLPFLARSFEFTDSVTSIVKLREGIQFHDGSEMNAESVKYTMDWVMDKKNGCWSRGYFSPVKSIKVVDTYTLKFNLKHAWASMQGIMGTVPGYAVSAKALAAEGAVKKVEKLKKSLSTARKKIQREEKKLEKAAVKGGTRVEKIRKKLASARKKLVKMEKQYQKAVAAAGGAKSVDVHPVGTGPYLIEEGRSGNYLKLKRNPNWWFGKTIGQPEMPYPDGVVFDVIPDISIQLANLRAGKIDYMALSPTYYNMVKNDRRIASYSRPGIHLICLFPNHTKGKATDIRVRKAINHAIDRQALLQGLLFDQGTLTASLYPVEHWSHNPNLEIPKYDPELSKQLLKEAGYPNGLTLKGQHIASTEWATLTTAIGRMLKKVGIQWKVEALDWAAADDRMKNLEYDLAAGVFGYCKDPDAWASGYLPEANLTNYGRSHNKKAIPLVYDGRKELNEEKRQKIYWELEKALYDNVEEIFLWHPKRLAAMRKNVMGYNNEHAILGNDAYERTHPLWLKGGKR